MRETRRLSVQQWQVVTYGVLLLCMIAQLWYGVKLREIYYCQQRFTALATEVDQRRAEAADQDRHALDTLVSKVLIAKDRTQTLKDYLTERVEADKLRAENPIPTLKDTCG